MKRTLAALAFILFSGMMPAPAGVAAAQPQAASGPSPAMRRESMPGYGWLSTLSDLRAQHRSSLVSVLDRRGEPLAQLRQDHRQLQLDWLALEDHSPALIRMVLRAEDQDFERHAGVDFAALLAALRQQAQGGKRGASTISMQLVGMLDADLARDRRTQTRSVGQKISQATSALWLERRWSKAQILEAYLNKVPLSGELVGMAAASRALFGKAAHGLNEQESAILAAMLRAPNAAPATIARRACQLLQASACELMEGQVRIALSQARRPDLVDKPLAAHYARHLLRPDSVLPLRTTIDARLQRLANEALQRHLRELMRQQVEDGAVLVLDRLSGEVLAWVGSSGSLSDAAQVDYVLARRQAGSTLKPFLYAQAIEERRLTAASLLDDRPVDLSTVAGLYVPRNYEAQYAGPVSARTALASSLNIPAVRVAVMLTPERVFQTLSGLGLRMRESGGYFGYSIALGSAEVSLQELTQAYRQLSLLDRRSAGLSPASKFIVGDMLADNPARALTFGLNSPLATRGWAAAKTGTSKDMRDNWCIGFTDRYVIGVWVGNASGEPMHRVSGVTGAAPIWAELVQALHRDQVSRPPQAPAGLVRQALQFEGAAQDVARQEWFLPGTERSLVRLESSAQQAPRILHPVSGTILALDPDIPPQQQRLVLRASGRAPGQFWQVDGQRLPAAGGLQRVADSAQWTQHWLPRPGRHWLSLHDASGQLVDKVWVEVRGAVERPPSAARRPGAGGQAAREAVAQKPQKASPLQP